MGIFKTITYIAGAITLGLVGYLYKVLEKSGYLAEVAEIPADDIMGFHIVAAVIIVWLLFSLIMKAVSRALVIGILILALAVEGTFLGMNLSGMIVEETKSLPEQLLEKGEDLLEEMKDKLSG